jgi:hypothetical protein
MIGESILDENGCFVASTSVESGIRALGSQKQVTPILDLRGIPFSKIPDQIVNINGLEELYLDENGLRELPEAIGKIEQLKVLSLGRNSFSRLPLSLVERWATLQKLFLGANQIRELGFNEEDLWAFQHGSIGTNPLPEPISRQWMIRSDAHKIPEIMKSLVPPKISSEIAFSLAEQLIQVLELASEPMIFEILYDGVHLNSTGDITWNCHFDRPWLRYIAVSLLPKIVRGSMVDRSLWLWNINRINISELPKIPLGVSGLTGVEIVGDIK